MSSKKTAGAVHDAIRKGSLTEVKKCLKKGSSVNETNASKQTPLHTAAIEGQLTILLYLIEKKKCDVNAKDRDGWTPLHCACHSGHLEIVDQLISHDANLNFETSNGSMPLHYFVRMPAQSTRPALFERLFRTMIRKGVNINQQNQQGETPLHMAAFRGKEKSVALLLWNQADPNLKNKYGETPLHLAARAGYSNVLKQLLEVGADYNIAGCNGTAFEIAINNNNQEMIAIFEEKMKPEDKILLQKGLEGKKAKPDKKITEKERLERSQSINEVVYAYPTENTQTMNHLPTIPFNPNQTPAPTPNIPAPTGPAPTPNQPASNQAVPQPGFYPYPYNGMPPTGQAPMPYYYPGYYPGGSAVFQFDPNVPIDPNNPNSYPMMNPNNFPPGYPMPFYPNQINPNDPNAQAHLAQMQMNINNQNQNQNNNEVNKSVNEPISHPNILPQVNQDSHHNNNNKQANEGHKEEKPAQKVQEKPQQKQAKPQQKPQQEEPKIPEKQPKPQQPKHIIEETPKEEEEKPKGVSASNRATLRKKTNTNSLKKGAVPGDKPGAGAGPKRNPKANNNNNTPTSNEPPKLENYHIGELIDRGAFGAVYRGLDIKTGAIVAIKQVPLAGVPPKELQTIMAELNLLKRLENKYIVRYIGFVQDEANINFVMEYIEGGSLAKLIQKFGKLPETLCAKYVSQVLLGLDYIHRRGVIHRDIKCANILITKDGTVKLADFGIAATPEGQEAEATLKTLKDGQYKNNNSNKEAVGSPYWMAPEIILLEGASTNSDIWSLGSTVIELVSGAPPYIDLAPMAALFAVVQDPHPPIPVDISNDLRDFLLLCFNKQPNERPTARELLKHPFIINNVGDLSSELFSSSASVSDFSADLPVDSQPKAINKPKVQQELNPKPVANKQQQSPKVVVKQPANTEGGDQNPGAAKPTRAGTFKRRQSTPVANQNPPSQPANAQPSVNPLSASNPANKPPVKQQAAKVQVKQTAVKQTINQPANQPVQPANPVKQPANQPAKGPTRAPAKQGAAAGGQGGGAAAGGQGVAKAGGTRRVPQKQGSGNNNAPKHIEPKDKQQDINSSIAELKMSADRTFRPYDLDNLPTMTNINVTSILQSFGAPKPDEHDDDDDKTDEDKTDEDKTDEDKTDEDKTDEDKSEDEDEDDEEDEQKMQLARTTKQLTELMKWARSAMDSDQGARACKLRTALRKEKKILRSRFRDFPEARELASDIRKLCKDCEEKFSEFILIDESDSDYDSEDSFFLADDDEDEYEDEEFVDGF